MTKAIEAEALLIFENDLTLSIRKWKYKETVRLSAGRGIRGLVKEPHQITNVFQGPTYGRELDPQRVPRSTFVNAPPTLPHGIINVNILPAQP